MPCHRQAPCKMPPPTHTVLVFCECVCEASLCLLLPCVLNTHRLFTPLQEPQSNIQSSSCTHRDNILLDRYTRGCKPPATLLCGCLAALRLPVNGMGLPDCACGGKHSPQCLTTTHKATETTQPALPDKYTRQELHTPTENCLMLTAPASVLQQHKLHTTTQPAGNESVRPQGTIWLATSRTDNQQSNRVTQSMA
jgi:hypothetical protein